MPVESEDESSPRRSGRSRKSTTIQIDGHTVLRQNNYSVTGMEYIFHEEDDDTPLPEGQYSSSNAPVVKKAKIQSSPRKPRVISAAEHARRNHNEAIRAAVEPKKSLRKAFLAKHEKLLEPFCEPHVAQYYKDLGRSVSSTIQEESIVPPKMVAATLRPYQRKGLDFMVRMHRQNLPMILGDEMGLGKSLQTLSLLCHLKEEEGVTGPSLIICPLSVLSSWCNEMTKWAPTLSYFRLHASDSDEQARQKQTLAEHATEYDVILTTYEMAKVPLLTSLYQRLSFHYVVLDEAQKIKGHETLIAQAVRKIHAGNKLLLTGTPLQNNLIELWSLLNYLYPEVFTTTTPFEKHFDLSENIIDKVFLGKTQRLLELFMLRRLKKEVEKLIPEKLETKVYCPLSKAQVFWYRTLLMKDVSSLSKMESADGTNVGQSRFSQLRSLFMQLRKACLHPFLFDGAEPNPALTTLDDLVGSSGKLAVLDMLLLSLFQKGNRSVLFSQFTTMLDLIEDYCIMRGWKYCRMDGSTDRAKRNYIIRRFNEPESPYFLFLVSTKCGGMGLNLQTADTCIIFDSDWNPQNDIQAMGRVHRIGQTKKVHVYRLVSSGTVEERMIERAEKKLLLEMVNQETGGDIGEKVRGLSADELFEDIKFGSAAIFGDAGSNQLPSKQDIDAITNRLRKENDSVGLLKGGMAKSAKSFDASKEFSQSHMFGGTDFREIRRQQEERNKRGIPDNLKGIAHLWHEIQSLEKKRAVKSRIVQIDGHGSGYGSAAVPVLASNNYELQNGESSVFDRELKKTQRAAFALKGKKKGPQFENQDHCQICGDGGTLVLCSQCPCSLHLRCVGLRNVKEFRCCTHHNCFECGKNRASAGGLLYPCNACSRSFCDDCLPKNGVTYLERLERFDAMGFDSAKGKVYIHCSPICEKYAEQELGYKPSRHQKPVCPDQRSFSRFFGASYDLDAEEDRVHEEKMKSDAQGIKTRTGKSSSKSPTKTIARKVKLSPKQTSVNGLKPIYKICPNTLKIIQEYPSMKSAAQSVGLNPPMLSLHMKHRANESLEGFYWKFKVATPQKEGFCRAITPEEADFPSSTSSRNSSESSLFVLDQQQSPPKNDDSPIMVSSSCPAGVQQGNGKSMSSPIVLD